MQCVWWLAHSDAEEIEKITIPHRRIGRQVIRAAERLGIREIAAFASLEQGRSVELETILLEHVRKPMARHLKMLMRQPQE